MPILKDFRKTKKIKLPSYPDSEVVIYDSLLIKDTMEAEEIEKNPTIDKALKCLPNLIKEWNFTDENKNILPITAENLNLLSVDDVTFIFLQIKEFADSLKKK